MPPTTTEENKRLVEKHIESFNEKDLTAFLETLAENAVIHGANEDYEGTDGLERFAATQVERFPDGRITVEDLFAAGNRVALRFTLTGTQQGPFLGADPTGQEVQMSGMAICRVEDGEIAEIWLESDQSGVLQQFGVLPSPDEEAVHGPE